MTLADLSRDDCRRAMDAIDWALTPAAARVDPDLAILARRIAGRGPVDLDALWGVAAELVVAGAGREGAEAADPIIGFTLAALKARVCGEATTAKLERWGSRDDIGFSAPGKTGQIAGAYRRVLASASDAKRHLVGRIDVSPYVP